MTCTCLDDTLTTLANEQKKRTPKHVEGSFSADWENAFYEVANKGKQGIHGVAMPVVFTYRRLTAENVERKTDTIKRRLVFMNFCPMCGEPMDNGGMQDAE